MLGKRKGPLRTHEKLESLIGEHTVVSGGVEFSGGLIVEGSVKGEIRAVDAAEASLILKNTGHIEGDVRVPRMEINGTISGDVFSDEYLALKENAKVTGNVYYRLLEMAVGAEVNGQLVHQSETSADGVAKVPLPDGESGAG